MLGHAKHGDFSGGAAAPLPVLTMRSDRMAAASNPRTLANRSAGRTAGPSVHRMVMARRPWASMSIRDMACFRSMRWTRPLALVRSQTHWPLALKSASLAVSKGVDPG
jgi:hypothetical protein